MSYVLAFLGFAALIILHEAGHFAAAKAVGMRVERFSLFFGPMLVKFRRGETEYGIGPIPLGGYVKITGMNPNEDIPPEARPRAYYNQKVWKRVVVILAGPAVNLVIAFGIILALALSQGQIVVRGGQPVFSHRVQLCSRRPRSTCAAEIRSSPSTGERNLTVPQITDQINQHHCAGTTVSGCRTTTPVHLLVRRGQSLLPFTIYPRYDAVAKRVRLGFAFPPLTQPVGVATASGQSVSYMWRVTKQTVRRIVQIFKPQDRRQLHGVVGGYTVTSSTSPRTPRWRSRFWP